MPYAALDNDARFPVVDGLRSLATLWLIAFHVLWYPGWFILPEVFSATVEKNALSRLVAAGHFGVDMFFALSGFLIAHILFGMWRERRGGMLLSFYTRRAFRIVPAYLVCALAFVPLSGFLPYPPNLHTLWANILFINNYLPGSQLSIPWTWSLAIEEQFYFVFPLLLLALRGSFRRLTLAVLGLLSMSLALRFFVVLRSGPWPYMPVHPLSDGVERFVVYFDALYTPTHMRMGALCTGILARCALESEACTRWLGAHPAVARLLPLLALSALFYVVYSYPLGLALHVGRSYADFNAVCERCVFAGAVAYLIFHSAAAPSQSSWWQRFLGHRYWRSVAELSYSAFLFNSLVICVLLRYFAPRLQKMALVPLSIYALLSFGLTFAVSYPVWRFVEVPCRRAGKRLTSSTPSLLRGDRARSMSSFER